MDSEYEALKARLAARGIDTDKIIKESVDHSHLKQRAMDKGIDVDKIAKEAVDKALREVGLVASDMSSNQSQQSRGIGNWNAVTRKWEDAPSRQI
jgi:hypothetical protein